MNKSLFSTGAAAALVAALTFAGVAPANADELPETPVEIVAPAETPAEQPVEELPAEEPEVPAEEIPAPEVPEVPTPEVPEVVVPEDGGNGEDQGGESGDQDVFGAVIVRVDAVNQNSATVYVGPANPADETIDSYELILTRNGSFIENQMIFEAGQVTFSNLATGASYAVEVRATHDAGLSGAGISFTTADERAGAPRIVTAEIALDSVLIVVDAPATGGTPTEYVATISTEGGFTATQTKPQLDAFEFTGLEPGLYNVNVGAYNASGGNAVDNYYFIIPTAPASPNVSVTGVTDSSIELSLKDTTAYPTVDGPLARVPVTFTVTATAGDDVRTATFNATQTFYTFQELEADTKYTITVTANNIAGSSEAATATGTTLAEEVTPEVPGEPETPVDPETPGEGGEVIDTGAAYVTPNPELLNGSNTGSLTVIGGNVITGSQVTLNVGSQFAGKTVYGTIFSDPVYLGTAVVNADGTVTFNIPSNVPNGEHRIVVTDEDNNIIGWVGVTLTDGQVTAQDVAEVKQLAKTGGEFPIGITLTAAMLLLAAGGVLVARRRVAAE